MRRNDALVSTLDSGFGKDSGHFTVTKQRFTAVHTILQSKKLLQTENQTETVRHKFTTACQKG